MDFCHANVCGFVAGEGELIYPRQGSNLRPFAPEANALIH